MNASAVAIFVFSPEVHWLNALFLGAGAILGGLGGAWMLQRVPELPLKLTVVEIGIALTFALFLRPVLTQYCSLSDLAGGGEVDADGRQWCSRSQRVVAHLALNPAWHLPASAAFC